MPPLKLSDNSTVPFGSGPHFGSMFPGHPSVLAVYDLLPTACMHRVQNLSDFVGALVFDVWLCNRDRRGAIFYRGSRSAGSLTADRAPFVVSMIDNGMVFGGARWELDGPQPNQSAPLYIDKTVYDSVIGWSSFEPWLEKLDQCADLIVTLVQSVPQEWVDEPIPLMLLENIWRRRRQVPGLIGTLRTSPLNPFRNWTATTAHTTLGRHC